MIVFLDTDFIELDQPELLSIGVAAENGLVTCLEIDPACHEGQRVRETAGTFARHLPARWCRRGFRCSSGRQAGQWLQEVARFDADLKVVFDNQLDVDLLNRCLTVSGALHATYPWPPLSGRLEFIHAGYLAEPPEAGAAAEAVCQEFAELGRHDPMVGALALRARFLAVHGTP